MERVPRARKSAPPAEDAPLAEYARKREFDKTPEPGPATAAPGPALRFCIQRHDATRLHYDLRLEVDGVFKSWAVPKGVTLDPTKKPLAMMVEDHPIDYGGFEGNIPKGEYGGGSVMLWDRGVYEPLGDVAPAAQLARGDFKFRLRGDKLKGDFAIVLMKGRGKGNEWLVIKKRDGHDQLNWDPEQHNRSVLTGRTQEEIAANLPSPAAGASAVDPASIAGAARVPMPATLTPMMASLADTFPSGGNWLYEIKWDGVRALCFIENGAMYILTRNGNRCERQYPELDVLPHRVRAVNAILDGEIAVLDPQGRPRFSLIQPRIAQTDPNAVAHLARSTPATLFAFDLIYLDGFDLRGAALADRKQALRAVLQTDDRIRVSDHFEATGPEMLEAARQAGLEGVVAKRADSKYETRRVTTWLKFKAHSEQEFVICGFTHGEREYFSSLVLGVYEGGALTHAGQVGTGFDDKTIRAIYQRLQPLITTKSPFRAKARALRQITWVEPKLVCQVRFVEWTQDGQLRAPSFQGLREDVDPAAVVRETGGAAPDDAPAPQPPKSDLIPPGPKELTLEVGAQKLRFTNLNKVFYPKQGYTKRDLLNYYDAVAAYLLPHLRDRPLSLKRYPNGIEADYFFQKNAEDFPPWVRLEPITSDERTINYVIANDRETLLWLTHLGCIDQNPWMSRLGTIDSPDFLLIDLDPVGCAYDLIVEAALLAKATLDRLGLRGYPKTTGGDGMHIYVPLEPVYSYDQVRSFAEIVSRLVIASKPDLFTTPRSVAKRRTNRVYFDYLQIASSKTISAPYVLRAYDGAPVATPLAWSEVRPGLLPSQFTIQNAPSRFASIGDVFRPVLDSPQRLEPAMEKLEALLKERA
ncbi:MAG: DNA ligase D [Acidobacteria bacterium]|nr:DNA ligase D [Acidobacteriota bacterium]